MSNVPSLRFPEFSGEWEEEKLGDLGSFNGGGTPDTSISKYWQGNIPWISSSDIKENDISNINIYRFINELSIKESATKIIPKDSILFVSRVGVGKLAISKQDLCTSQDFTNLTLKKPFNSYFIGNYFLSKNNILVRHSQGTSIKGFTTNDIKSIKLMIPNTPEQQKIASFLSSIDKRIEQLRKKHSLLEDYKKGVMQQIFSQQIRFKDDNGNDFPDWEEKKLEEVFERVTRKNKEDNKNVLTISAIDGLINQEEYFNKSVAAKDVTGYYLLNKNEFAYNKSYSKGFPMGAIKRLKYYDKGVVSTLYICFRAKENIDIEFYDYFFDSGGLNRELHKIAQEGARNHGLLNMSVVEFFSDITIPVPSLLEQRKISDFLTEIEAKTVQSKKQLELTEQFKKALLQRMFV